MIQLWWYKEVDTEKKKLKIPKIIISELTGSIKEEKRDGGDKFGEDIIVVHVNICFDTSFWKIIQKKSNYQQKMHTNQKCM